ALQAQLASVRSQTANINAQVEVQKEQLQIALNDLNRIQSLAKDNAATQQQLDDIQGKVRVLRQQMNVLQTQKESVQAEIKATKARIAQVDEQIQNARIINPLQGTVLDTYVEQYELV